MKILIVNAYSPTPKGMQSFSEFQWSIKRALNLQKDLIDTETEIFIRDRENLDDFLYELDSSYIKKEAAKSFDHLDMIFIIGDPFLLPWVQQARKVMILIRMGMRVQKSMFLSAFAMQAFVFLCSTNFDKNIHIINGKGKGGKLGEIVDLDRSLSQLSSTDFFLDNLTGDLYSFHYDNNEWVTKANAGLHYEKTVQEYHTLGKYLLKVPTYRTKNLNDDKHVFITRKSESICYIKKNYINHWLVQNIDKEFLMENKSAWTIHTFNFLHKDKTFSVLADNDKGPTIICINNVAGVIFEIKQKYIPSQIILKNFVVFTIKSIKTMQNEHRKNIENFYNIKESPQIIFHKYNGEGYLKNRSIHFRVVSENYTNIQKKKIEENNEFRHVGFSANKSHIPSIYKKNIIRDNTLQNSTRDFNLNKKNNDDFFSTINVRPKYKSDIKKKEKPKSLYNKKISYIDFNQIPTYEQNQIEIQPINNNVQDTPYKIRKILHPNISSEGLPLKDDIWVPGEFSKNLSEEKRNIIWQNKTMGRLKKTKTKKISMENTSILNLTPSDNIMSYKFRNVTPEKWVSGAFRI